LQLAFDQRRFMKVREAIRLIEDDGWYLVATRGSHRQYKHPRKTGRVTIAGKPSEDLAPGTRSSIMKQAGLKERR
jgi:predicted RNA binding protein YcfA (HicA-like mRNA interferase family)